MNRVIRASELRPGHVLSGRYFVEPESKFRSIAKYVASLDLPNKRVHITGVEHDTDGVYGHIFVHGHIEGIPDSTTQSIPWSLNPRYLVSVEDFMYSRVSVKEADVMKRLESAMDHAIIDDDGQCSMSLVESYVEGPGFDIMLTPAEGETAGIRFPKANFWHFKRETPEVRSFMGIANYGIEIEDYRRFIEPFK